MAREETFLGRWSRLKREDEKEKALPQPPAAEAQQPEEAAPALPPVEELTPKSDFKAFMHPKVQDAVRRVALKKLFADPHFNVPDLNEAYSGDWTGGEPITPEMLKQLNQARTHLFSDEERKAYDEAEEKARQETEQAQAPQAPAQQAQPQDGKSDEPGKQDT